MTFHSEGGRFWDDDVLAAVLDFVDSHEEQQSLQYSLASNYPRRVFTREGDGAATLAQLGLSPQALLFVQPLDD